MSKKYLFIVFVMILAGLVLNACSLPWDKAIGDPIVGRPNPASVYCEEQGGSLEIRDNSMGVCNFEDGSECEEWAYYRGECQPGDMEVAPTHEPIPWYINDEYGFSFDSTHAWSLEGYENYIIFVGDEYQLFVGYQWADEDVPPFRTGLPAGEFQDSGSVTFLGQELPKKLLVYEGKVKMVDYGSGIGVGDLRLSIWLDIKIPEGGDYADLEIPAEIISEADDIVATFALTSGETPVIEVP